jgi:uncharacterized protein
MRVLVTGSTGFIGRHLGMELARRGHELVCLVRDPARADLPFPAQLHAWGAPGALRDVDAVVHLAGESIGAKRWTKAQKIKIMDSRVATTRELAGYLKAATGRKPRVLLCASGAGYYGDRADEILREESAPGKGFLAEVCEAWEGAAAEMESFIPRVARIRTGVVLGREGGALAAMLPLFKAGLGGRLGSGRQWMSWIHLDDLVHLYCFALEEESIRGPLNAVAPNPVTNAEFTKALASQLKVPALLPAPAFALKLALGEMSALLLESQRVATSAPARGFRFRYERLGEALSAVFKHVEKARGPFFHEYTSRQWLPRPAEEVFAFLTDPKQLEALTPPVYELKVEGHSTVKLRENSTVDYSLNAAGRRAEVRSLLFDFVENHRYSSTHQEGPFSFWRHSHTFERLAGGTLLTDRVIYRCPGSLPGSLFGSRWVEKHLNEIFRFRRRKLAEVFTGRQESGERPSRPAV